MAEFGPHRALSEAEEHSDQMLAYWYLSQVMIVRNLKPQFKISKHW